MRALRRLPDTGLRDRSFRIGLAAAVAGFLAAGVPMLLDQWILGQASALFILGTALVLAGICTGMFAAIVAAGLLVSLLCGDHDRDRGSRKGLVDGYRPR